MRGLTARPSYIVFYPSQMEGHVALTFQFFCLSVIPPVMNKASHQCDLSLCHSNAYRKIRKEKRLFISIQVEPGRNSSISFDFSV